MGYRFFLSTFVVGVFACASLSATGPLDLRQPAEASTTAPSEDRALSAQDFPIPGPLRSFLRMAGISQQIPVTEVLPSLSWNVSALGFQGSDRPTEFLVLLRRYVVQARELTDLAGADGVIRISNCEEAKPLLRILGYRTLGQCGEQGTSLLTADAERAFLTVDSGFPLTDLEQTLSGGKPFEYPYPSTRVPVLFVENDWTSASSKNHIERSKDLLDTLLDDRAVSRLYWAVSKMDPQTATYLRQNGGVRKLIPYAPLLDFYGTHLCIRNGRVLVPGGPSAERTWEELVGASPAAPADFIPRLLLKDKGWLVAYFDVLSIVNSKQQTEFTEAKRLHRFYDALRPPDRSSNAARGVFRPSPWLLLLASQARWDQNGQPWVPGNLDVWREALKKDSSRAVREREKNYPAKTPEELLEAMFARARKETDTGALQAYITLVDLDSKRPAGHRLSPEITRVMIQKYADYSDQYRVFSEFPELSDASISLFLETAEELGKVPSAVRANALGIIQANISLWQILARQGQIANGDLDDSWQNVVKPFSHIHSASDLYDAGRSSLAQLSRASIGKTAISQDDLIELLAGPRQTTTEGKRIHREMADRIRSVLNGQRIVSLDTLTTLGDALKNKESGTTPPDYLFDMAGELHEFEMPQPMFTKGEREEWAARIYNNHHTDLQMRSNVGAILKSPKASRGQIEDARGQLTSFLRDTLVALNYAYYEPPGAQALHNNPLFVRSHDFAGETVRALNRSGRLHNCSVWAIQPVAALTL